MPTYEDEMKELSSTMGELLTKTDTCRRLSTSQRAALLGELEACTRQLAEREEMERVRITIELALESGSIESPVATHDLGECPLCFEDILHTFPATNCAKQSSTHHRFYCCGKVCCIKCIEKRDEKLARSIAQYNNAATKSIVALNEINDGKARMNVCPFCRSPNHGKDHIVALVRQHAEAGKPWAQYKLGQMMIDGLVGPMSDVNYKEAIKWLERAAENGDFGALTYLYKLWKTGYPEAGMAPNQKTSLVYLRHAARRGHWQAQYHYAESLGSKAEAFLWYTLSAAQGFAQAQFAVGMRHSESCDTVDAHHRIVEPLTCLPGTGLLTCVYWLKKAALQGAENAQSKLPFAMLRAKKLLIKEEVNSVGYSVVPEACFWFDLALYGMKHRGEDQQASEYQRPTALQIFRRCACCKKKAGGAIQLQCCGKCKGVGYCGRECQVKHWKMGHQRDCKAVEDCRTAMTVPCERGYPYPVRITIQ